MSGATADCDVHVSSYPWASQLWRKDKRMRRAMLKRCRDVYPVSVYVLAAVEIQRVWRGILLRRRVLAKYMSHDFVRRWKEQEAAVIAAYRVAPRAMESQFVVLARRVQARWRTALLRKEFVRWNQYEIWPVYYVAAATIQRAWVDHRYAKTKRKHRMRSKRFFLTKQDAAAGSIQTAWRNFVSRSVFRFYVQLIRFRERGDPALMLRAINPNETNLMDPAAGLHVRFRLGGVVFPPTVYYRVYTHNNVADVCSFAPKDYTVARRHPTTAMVHNKHHGGGGGGSSKAGWYQRVENNPWRPVATMVLKDAELLTATGPGTSTNGIRFTASARDVIPPTAAFHHSRLKRREDRAQRERATRRKWLAELYAAEQVELLRNSSGGAPDRLRSEAVLLFASLKEEDVDEEVARLCSWTEHLDFSTYRHDWLKLATTAPTDALGPAASSSLQPRPANEKQEPARSQPAPKEDTQVPTRRTGPATKAPAR